MDTNNVRKYLLCKLSFENKYIFEWSAFSMSARCIWDFTVVFKLQIESQLISNIELTFQYIP
jgi:hypothetical protein